MNKRYNSPDQITAYKHSIEKQPNRKLQQINSEEKITTIIKKDQGEIIGHYFFKKKDQIGSGYTSRVYKCKNLQNNCEYAMKIIELKRHSPSSLVMLQNQIQILKALDHPNIIRFENVYKTATHCYLITEYCPHGDLLSFIIKNCKICEKESISIASQIIQATKYLFKMGILHRDIKPSNVFRHSKCWKIGDFGFSIRSFNQIKTSQNVGTPIYMPLESLLKNIYSPQSDIFAVGVIFYQMITGVTPWQCRTQKQLIKKLTNTPFAIPQKYTISTPIKKLLERLCAVKKENRMTKKEFLELDIVNLTAQANNQPNSQIKRQRRRIFSLPSNYNEKVTLNNNNNQKTQNLTKNLAQTMQIKKQKIPIFQNWIQTQKKVIQSLPQQKIQQKVSILELKNVVSIICQLKLCRFMYYLIENSTYLCLSPLNRGRVCLILFKYILKLAKLLSDNKKNWFDFNNWQHFKKSAKYSELHPTLKQYCQKIQKEYLLFLKKSDMSIIKQINQILPQFSSSDQFTLSFYRKLLVVLYPLLKECLQNVSTNKSQHQNNARFQALKSFYKYFQLIQLNIKYYQHFQIFAEQSKIFILKDYRSSNITLNQIVKIKEEIRHI